MRSWPSQPTVKEGFPEERRGAGWEGGEGTLDSWSRGGEHCQPRKRGALMQEVGEYVGLGSCESLVVA